MTQPRRLGLRVVVATTALALAAGCTASVDPDDEPRAEPSRSSSPKPRGPGAFVVAISVDGLNPTALTRLGPQDLPSFYEFIEGGATTLNARTELEQTETLPNHTGMLTGRPITGPDGHGVEVNADPGGVTVESYAGHEVASIFDTVHDARGSTALYASKTKFALFQRTWADALDRVRIEEDNTALVRRLVDDLLSDPARFSFVHLSAPDLAGHENGFMGPDYLDAVRRVDGLLGQIRAAMAGSPLLRRGGYLVLTADHGGRGPNGHADPAEVDDYRIPFLVDGPGVPRGDLYALNPDYRDPGTGRPSYDGAQPVRNGDLADLSARLLGLPPVPGSVFGATDQLDVR